MQYTKYFVEQVRRKRPYLKTAWVQNALKKPIKIQKQTDGRIRYWIFIKKLNKYLRVVTLDDGKTIHNAFPDRNFKKEEI